LGAGLAAAGAADHTEIFETRTMWGYAGGVPEVQKPEG
jgi:hypothetical protein